MSTVISAPGLAAIDAAIADLQGQFQAPQLAFAVDPTDAQALAALTGINQRIAGLQARRAALVAAGAKLVPQAVTLFQLRAALHGLPGKQDPARTLFDEVDAAVKALGGVALQAWEYAQTVTRTGAVVSQVAAGLGVSDEALDDLFITAAAISA